MEGTAKHTLKQYWRHSADYKVVIITTFVLIIFSSALDIIEPLMIKWLFDTMTSDDPNRGQKAITILLYTLGLSVAAQVVWRSTGYIVGFLEARVMSNLLNTCYGYLLGHSYRFYSDNFVGSLVTRIRRFHYTYERIADIVIWEFSRLLFKTTSMIVVLFVAVDGLIGALVLTWCVVFSIVVYFAYKYKMKLDIQLAAQDTKVTGHLSDKLTNHINLKLFSSELYEFKVFNQITEELFKDRKRAWYCSEHIRIFQGITILIMSFAVMYFGVKGWIAGTVTVGSLVLLRSYLSQLFEQMWDFGRHIQAIHEGLADAAEMSQMLMEPHEVVDKPGAKPLVATTGKIEFSNVNFSYYEESGIFENFNLIIQPGQRIAFVGPSGSGKTTITKLLFRLIDIQSGKITIDGQDISEVTQSSLRQAIALVPQDPSMFHQTLFENIRYGRQDATDEEVIAAAKAAHAHEFISQFTDGYHTMVGGVKLSGGQRQRVAIARAFLKNAPILILDEATSSLDSESEWYIHDALKDLTKGKTTIMIAHRISTIIDMDPIIVLEKGEITEIGDHDSLMKAGGTYQKLWSIQARQFSSPNV